MTPPRVKDLLGAFCSGSSPKDSTNSSYSFLASSSSFCGKATKYDASHRPETMSQSSECCAQRLRAFDALLSLP